MPIERTVPFFAQPQRLLRAFAIGHIDIDSNHANSVTVRPSDNGFFCFDQSFHLVGRPENTKNAATFGHRAAQNLFLSAEVIWMDLGMPGLGADGSILARRSAIKG